jgi:hypothetical protein
MWFVIGINRQSQYTALGPSDGARVCEAQRAKLMLGLIIYINKLF